MTGNEKKLLKKRITTVSVKAGMIECVSCGWTGTVCDLIEAPDDDLCPDCEQSEFCDLNPKWGQD